MTTSGAGVRAILLAIAAPLVAPGAQSEPPKWRAHHSAECAFELGDQEESGVLHLTQNGVLEWLRWSPEARPGERISDSLSLPIFDLNGDIAQVADGATFLVTGLDSKTSVAWVCLVRLSRTTPRQLVLVEQFALGTDVDPIAVVHRRDSGHIVILDRRGRRILAARWTPGTPLRGSSFVTVLDARTAPFLEPGREGWTLNEDVAGPGILVGWEGRSLGDWVIDPKGAAWAARRVPETRAWNRLRVDEPQLTSASWPLRVSGPPGPIEIVDLRTQARVATGEIAIGGQWQDLAPADAAPMVAGHLHELRAANAFPAQFVPRLRLGAPRASAAMRLSHAASLWDLCTEGSAHFAVIAHADLLDPPSGAGFVASFQVWIAATPETEPPPVTRIGGVSVLRDAVALEPVARRMANDRTRVSIRVQIPIDGLHELAGARLWFQFAVLDPNGEPVLSDVAAAPIAAAELQNASPSPPNAAQQRFACLRMLTGRSTTTGRALRARVLDALRR